MRQVVSSLVLARLPQVRRYGQIVHIAWCSVAHKAHKAHWVRKVHEGRKVPKALKVPKVLAAATTEHRARRDP